MTLPIDVDVRVPSVVLPSGRPDAVRAAAAVMGDAEGSLLDAAWRVAADAQAVQEGSSWCGPGAASFVAAAHRFRLALLSAADAVGRVARCLHGSADTLEVALSGALRARAAATRLAAERDVLVRDVTRLARERATAAAGVWGAAALFPVVVDQVDEVEHLRATVERLRAECRVVQALADDATTLAAHAVARARDELTSGRLATRAAQRAEAARHHEQLVDAGAAAAEDGSLRSRATGFVIGLRDDITEPVGLVAGLAGLQGDLASHWSALTRGVLAAVRDPMGAVRGALDWDDVTQGDWGHWLGTVGPSAFVTVASGGGYGAARTARVLAALRSQEELARHVRELLEGVEIQDLARLRLDWGSLSSPIVPGGGLAAHDLAGGHVLPRHVGLDTEQHLRRLTDITVPVSTSFLDRHAAERLVTEVLTVRAAYVANWLGGSDRELALVADLHRPTGVLVRRGRHAVEPVTGVKVVLVRVDTPLGFRIKTAFPWAPGPRRSR